jgi:hypothetical protein
MTVRQKAWFKSVCQVLVLFGGMTLFVRLGFQGYSVALTGACMLLLQVLLWGNIWSGEELSERETKGQYLHEAIGLAILVVASLVIQFVFIEPSFRAT